MIHKGHHISWQPVITSRDEYFEYDLAVDGQYYATYDTIEDVRAAAEAIKGLIDRGEWQSVI